MPSVLETLLALNGGNLPPLPNAAPSMPLLPAPQNPMPVGPAYGATPELMASDIAPRAPAEPLDMQLARAYQQFAPPPPTPPPAPTRLQQIAGVIGGIGAGLQGRGPEYTAFLQQPQQQYQAQLNANNQLRGELGMRGF